MKPGDIIAMHDTRMEILEAQGAPDRVRLRYIAPFESGCIAEWYEVATLLGAGWRVVPPIFEGVPPCMDV
jgi:hypothetical protein